MADLRIHAFDATLVDETDPVPGTPSGPLTAAGSHRGTERIEFSATDTGAGVYRGVTEVRKAGEASFQPIVQRVLDGNGGKCADAGADGSTIYEFVHRVPCKLAVSSSLDLDTTQLPDGVHELRVRVEDASGNSAMVHGPVAFEVDNVPPPGVIDPDGEGPADGMPRIAGTAVVGNTLVGDPGAWSGDGVSHALQWLRCSTPDDGATCAPIDGATGEQYRLETADLDRFVRLRVTATNAQGTATATSAAKGPVTAAAGTGGDSDGAGQGGDGAGAGQGGSGSAGDGAAGGSTPQLGTPNNGTNASNRAVITVTAKRRKVIAFGRRVPSRAVLRDEHGRPIAGARVAVLERMNVPGAAWTEAREPLTTDADGRLRWTIPAKYGRTIRYAYKANLANADFQATSDLMLAVRSKTTLRASKRFLRNGQTLRLSGRVLSRPVPGGGVLIDVQAKVGKRWQTFRTARSKGSGRWAVKYRFRATRGLQRYRFRARVRQDTGFPYTVSRSKSRSVRVAG